MNLFGTENENKSESEVGAEGLIPSHLFEIESEQVGFGGLSSLPGLKRA